jgi:Tol biopolymer transport system component
VKGVPLRIWQLSYPGNGAQRITNDLSNYTGISLTADSGILAAVRADELVNIWVAPSGDTSRAKQITSGAGRGDGRSGPAWTADDKIVYESFTGRDIHLWTMAADGTGNKQLTLTTRLNQGPALSPDGRSLVWVSHSDIGIAHIWRMELDGSNQKQLTNGAGEYYPQFSPDGNWIVYGEAGTDSMAGWLSLWKMPIDGGTPVRLTDKQSWVPVIYRSIAAASRMSGASRWMVARRDS